jgi:hypothetical protein
LLLLGQVTLKGFLGIGFFLENIWSLGKCREVQRESVLSFLRVSNGGDIEMEIPLALKIKKKIEFCHFLVEPKFKNWEKRRCGKV